MPLLLADQQKFDPTATARLVMQGLGEVSQFINQGAGRALERSRQEQQAVIEQTKIQQDAQNNRMRAQQQAQVDARLQADLQLRQQRFLNEVNAQRSVDQFRATGSVGANAFSPRPQSLGGFTGIGTSGSPGQAGPNGQPIRYNNGGNPSLPGRTTGALPLPESVDANGVPIDGQQADGSLLTDVPAGSIAPVDQFPLTTPDEARSGNYSTAESQRSSPVADLTGDIQGAAQSVTDQQARVDQAARLPGKEGIAAQKAEQARLASLQRNYQALLGQQTRNTEASSRIANNVQRHEQNDAYFDPTLRKKEADASRSETMAGVDSETQDELIRKRTADAAAAESNAQIKAAKAAGGGVNATKPITPAQITAIVRDKDKLDRQIADEMDAQQKIKDLESQDPTYRDAPPGVRGMLNKSFNIPDTKGSEWMKQATMQSKALQTRLDQASKDASSSGTQDENPAQPPQQNGPSGDGQKSAFDWFAQ